MFILLDELISSRNGSLVTSRAAAGLAYDHDVFMPCAYWSWTMIPEDPSTNSSVDLDELASTISAGASKARDVAPEKRILSDEYAFSKGNARTGNANKMLIGFNLTVRPHVFPMLFDLVLTGRQISGKCCIFPFNALPNMFISTMKMLRRKAKKYIQ